MTRKSLTAQKVRSLRFRCVGVDINKQSRREHRRFDGSSRVSIQGLPIKFNNKVGAIVGPPPKSVNA